MFKEGGMSFVEVLGDLGEYRGDSAGFWCAAFVEFVVDETGCFGVAAGTGVFIS